MSLDVYLEVVVDTGGSEPRTLELFERNITHHLNTMAGEAGIYKHLWRPEEIDITHAEQLIEPLRGGLKQLRADPAKFRAHNPSNGWGSYEGLVEFVADYLRACEENPRAEVRACG